MMFKNFLIDDIHSILIILNIWGTDDHHDPIAEKISDYSWSFDSRCVKTE